MIVIFTDLDGTLLDEKYSWKIEGISFVKKKRIPLVFCTGKTRAETEFYREKLGIHHPFIVENGGAIYIPRGYFSGAKNKIELGIKYRYLRNVLGEIKRRVTCRIKGFGDMSPREISMDCGLTLFLARLAKKREYDEPFIIDGSRDEKKNVLRLIKSYKLNHTFGGRYHHLNKNDKGKATKILISLYREKFHDLLSIGIGDAKSDIPMLRAVDIPVLMQKKDGRYERVPFKTYKTGIGPEGWKDAVMELI